MQYLKFARLRRSFKVARAQFKNVRGDIEALAAKLKMPINIEDISDLEDAAVQSSMMQI